MNSLVPIRYRDSIKDVTRQGSDGVQNAIGILVGRHRDNFVYVWPLYTPHEFGRGVIRYLAQKNGLSLAELDVLYREFGLVTGGITAPSREDFLAARNKE